MSKIFKPRRGSASVMSGAKANTVLAAGEMFVEFEGAIGNSLASIKFGDGSTAYSSLPYALKNVNPTSTAITITPDASSTSAAALNNVVSNTPLGKIIGSLKQAISLTKVEVNASVNSRLSVNNTPFYFDYQNSKYGYNTSPNREAASFHPFREPHTATYTASSRAASLDMGEDHIYRYINTNNVPNTNSTTYTFAANDTGGTKDMGATNNYRYVNATNVYNKGKADGVTIHTTTYTPTSRSDGLDMGQRHTYRYVNTNSVPNTNSGLYTFVANDTGGTKDMGATNTYRYVNAENVYNKGKADGVTIHTGIYTYDVNSTGGTIDMGERHTYRYVNAGNVYNKGYSDGITIHTDTFAPTSRSDSLDMGERHTYRYVNTSRVPGVGTYNVIHSGGGSVYTFDYAYPCAVVFTGGYWIDSAICTGNNCTVGGGWAYYGDLEEHRGGRLWIVTDIKVGSQVSWQFAVGDEVTIIGIGRV